MAKAKSKTVTFGSIWAETDKDGEQTGKVYITLDKGITGLSIEGTDYKDNDISGAVETAANGKIYLNTDDPIDKLDFFLKGDYITKDQYDERVEKTPENLLAEISVKVG